MTAAISAGATAFCISFSGSACRFAGVSMITGTTTFTRTPDVLSSAASTSVSVITPALATAYAAAPGSATSPEREETLTMAPACMRRAAARQDHQAVPRFKSIMKVKSSGVESTTFPGR